MASQTVSVLGCGWLGFPLAVSLINQGFRVKGSTTTPKKCLQLQKAGILPYVLKCDPKLDGKKIDDFFKSDILILTVPFRRDFENPWEYKTQIDSIVAYTERSPIQFLIFTSSTSVYPQGIDLASEDKSFEPDNLRSKALLAVEQGLKDNSHFKSTIIRFSGLCGGGRQVGRFLSGKKDLTGGDEPVNLIHLDDCVQIICEIIQQGAWDEIFNACADEHPTRQELYVSAARRQGLPVPTFVMEQAKGPYKIVSNRKICRRLNYRFQHPNPLEF